MKKLVFCLWILLGLSYVQAKELDCSEAHSPASYALFHTKKALKADNFDHQKYYAERALEAFEKTKSMIENCGCQNALVAIDTGSENLKKAIDPEDWDKGRFFTKKALADAENMIDFLELCTSGSGGTRYSSNNDNSYASASNAKNENVNAQKEIIDRQKQLQQQQQRLIEEQKKLDRELEEQRKIAEQREIARQRELQQQIKLKVKAEQALQNFEKSISELQDIMGCKEAYNAISASYLRTEKALESESLIGTRRFYTERARDIAKKALDNLESCARQSE